MDYLLSSLLNVSLENYTLFIYGWLALALVASFALYVRGDLPISSKLDNVSKSTLGSINKKLGWIIMETPILISVLYFYFAGSLAINVSAIIMCAFVLHYVNRALIYPHRIKTQGKRMPVSSVINSMIFYSINGYLIGYYFGELRSYDLEWLWDPRFIIGSLLFMCGLLINIHSDNILIHLRKPNETGYKIPQGGLFRFVSCPNYFGEIIEWIGFAIMSWSLPGLMYAIWVAGPLISQSLSAHRWYVHKFKDDYPKERKALIPFII